MQVDFDAIVIGAGFAGAATAYHLSRSGKFKIAILEKEDSAGRHASGKNAGLLRQAIGDVGAAEMVQETLHALREAPADWKRKEIFRESGSLLIGETISLSRLAGIMKNLGARFEMFDRSSPPKFLGDEWRSLLDSARFESLLYSPQDGVVDPRGLLENYLNASRARGVSFRCGNEVKRIARESGNWTVETAGGRYRSSALVNAAGAWAETMGNLAGLPERGLIPRRRHLFVSTRAEGLAPESPYFWDLAHEFYFRPEAGGLLLSPGDEEPQNPGDPEVDPAAEKLLRDKLGAHFPALAGVEIASSRACLRTAWKGGSYLVSEEPRAPGFFWMAGLGGHGMGSSFGLGRLAAGQVAAFLNRQNP